jgi:hypothetical protein
MKYYSPHTYELINTETPADWMLSTELAVPEFDSATQSAYFIDNTWVIKDQEAQVEGV